MSVAQRRILRIVDGGPRGLNLEGLVPLIAAGDEPAAAQFYDSTSGLLFGLLLLMLSDTATAEKVLLEVYAEVRQQAASFDETHQSLLAWLITIAHRRALEHLCSSSEDRQFLVSIGLAVPRRSGVVHRFGISKAAHRRLIDAALEDFSATEQKMIELAYFSRLTPQAVAMELRQAPAIVSAGLQSGIAQLYRLFKNQEFVTEVEPRLKRPQPAHSLRWLPSA